MINSPTKQCTKCKVEKPLDMFPNCRHTRCGKGSHCKACMQAYSLAYSRSAKGKESLARAYEKQRAAGYFRFGKGAILALQNSSKARGLSNDITAESLEAWWHKTPDSCAYCGITTVEFLRLRDFVVGYSGDDYGISKFHRIFKSPKHAKISCLTLDRTDNSIGYTLTNIVKACWFCNSIKGSLLCTEDMRAIAPAIIRRLQASIANTNRQ